MFSLENQVILRQSIFLSKMGIAHTRNAKKAKPCKTILLTDVYGKKCGLITKDGSGTTFLENSVLFSPLKKESYQPNSILDIARVPHMKAFFVDSSLWEEEWLQIGESTNEISPIQITPHQLKKYLQIFHYPIYFIDIKKNSKGKEYQLKPKQNQNMR